MSLAYFISDLHLGLQDVEAERKKEQALLSFLDHVKTDSERLYILGDLFDFWFEYRHVIPKGYYRVLGKLRELSDDGMTIRYLAGNHDFWVRSFFREELGMDVHMEPFEETLNRKRFFFHHGDGLALHDTGYRILKRVLRCKVNIFLYSLLHPDIGIALGRLSSRLSRYHSSTRNYGEGDGMVEYAARRIAEGIDYVVMGHRHEPMFKPIGNGIYVNLGDWIEHRTYGIFDGNEFRLERWD